MLKEDNLDERRKRKNLVNSSAIVGYCLGLLPPKQHREREKLLCYSGPKSVRECAELSIGCDVITKGKVWGPSNGAFGVLVKNIFTIVILRKHL